MLAALKRRGDVNAGGVAGDSYVDYEQRFQFSDGCGDRLLNGVSDRVALGEGLDPRKPIRVWAAFLGTPEQQKADELYRERNLTRLEAVQARARPMEPPRGISLCIVLKVLAAAPALLWEGIGGKSRRTARPS